MSGTDGGVALCPLCLGNGNVPTESVGPLVRGLHRRMYGPCRLVRDASGRVMEIRQLSESEVQLLGSGVLEALPT